jgi:hypothetical protein
LPLHCRRPICLHATSLAAAVGAVSVILKPMFVAAQPISGKRPQAGKCIIVYFLGPVSPMSARAYSLSFSGGFDGQLASSGLCDSGRSGWSELDADRARPYRSRDCRNMVVG